MHEKVVLHAWRIKNLRRARVEQGERLRVARQEKGFKTGTEAANAMGVSVATYNAHENGHRGLTVKAAERYAEFFDVRLAWLLSGEPPKNYMTQDEMAQAHRDYLEGNDTDRVWGRFLPGRRYMGLVEEAVPEVDAFNTEPAEDLPGSYGVVANWGIPTDFANHVLKGKLEDLFLLQISDNVMSELAKAGDRVIVDSAQNVVRGSGFYALKDADGHLHVRRITKAIVPEPDGRDIELSTDQPRVDVQVKPSQITVVGKVVGLIASV